MNGLTVCLDGRLNHSAMGILEHDWIHVWLCAAINGTLEGSKGVWDEKPDILDSWAVQSDVIGDLVIDTDAHEITLAGEQLELLSKEFDLLAYLAERPGEVVAKRQILAEVWRQPYGGSEKTVDVHLSWLRKKLGESAADSRYLQTVFGVGVKLVDPAA